MPQMAPLNWLTLLLYFTLIFIIFSSMNYFVFIYPSKSVSFKKNKLMLYWKW
nr:ATP synthase F0 subunit 8 [Aegosoma pallidum]